MHVWGILVVENNASKRKPLHFGALYGRTWGKNFSGFNFQKNPDRLYYLLNVRNYGTWIPVTFNIITYFHVKLKLEMLKEDRSALYF